MLLQECRWLLVGVGIGFLLTMQGCGGSTASPAPAPDAGAFESDAGPCEPTPADDGDCRSSLPFCKTKDPSFTCGYTPGQEPYLLQRGDAGACEQKLVDTVNGCTLFDAVDGGSGTNCCVVPGL